MSEKSDDRIVELNVDMLRSRSRVGLKKYGISLAQSGLTHEQFLQHALEEALDLANYIQSALQNPKGVVEQTRGGLKPCPFCGEAEGLIIQHCEGTIIHPALRIYCDNCGASSGYSDRVDPMENWNQRAALQSQDREDATIDHARRIEGEAMQSQPSHAGWKEAAIAWEVCASLHREFCKGRDPLFKVRQSDFVKHAEDARANALETEALQSQDREDAERLDFLDATNVPYKMGWKVGIAPAGNVSVSSVIQLGSTVTTIREAIDHARRVEGES